MSPEPLVAARDCQSLASRSARGKSARFTLVPGKVHALSGASGAGKSTLAGMISGQTARSGGSLTINGRSPARFSPREAIAAGGGIDTQKTLIADDLTIWENVTLPHFWDAMARVRPRVARPCDLGHRKAGLCGGVAAGRTLR